MGPMFLLLNAVSPPIDLILGPFLELSNEKNLHVLLIVPECGVCGEFLGSFQTELGTVRNDRHTRQQTPREKR